jgi:lipopolysaccharide export system permease protein
MTPLPLIWRYLLRHYFQVFILCMTSFIAALFVMRFKEIAEFATLNSDGVSILLFSLYQLPYVLPLAVPVSCMIAAMLLLQKMSHSHELTALRAAGLSINVLLYPLLIAGVVLSLINFTIVSEVGPYCRFKAKELSYQMTSNNPFYIFNKISEGKLTNAYVEIRSMRGGKQAKDVLLILNNRQQERLGVMTAKELTLVGDELHGKDVTVISSVEGEGKDNFDNLVIENQASMSTKAASLSQLLQGGKWQINPDYLSFKELLLRASASHKKIWLSHYTLEMAKRLSLALTPFAFTLIGATFGMEISRKRTKKGVLGAMVLAAFYLSAFVGAKSMRHYPLAVWALYFAPFVVMGVLATRSLKRIGLGRE